jgi:hypothetical protein
MKTCIVRVRSHRAREHLKRLTGGLPPGFFSWERSGEWREIPADLLPQATAIKGVTASRRTPDLRPYIY